MIMANSYDNDDENSYKLLKRLIHDLRSPLSGLLMWLQGTSSRLPEDEKMVLEKIAERMKGSLDGASSNADKKEVAKITLNIDNLIQEMLLEKKGEYMGYDIKIHYSRPNNYQDINIKGSKDDFVRMLSNLLNNSIEACNDKSGVIRIGLHKANHAITLSINDNGRGMPTEILQKLRNGEAITYGKKDGHGDGMGQIRDTIAKLNGTLDIKSMHGQGSTFAITFELN